MGRKPKVLHAEDGTVELRVKVPRPIWLTCETIANKLGLTPENALTLMFERIGCLFEEGSAAFLGPEWASALKQVRTANLGMIGAGPPINVNKLHRNDKIKSGFVGVYPNGNGFRAMGKILNSSQEKYLGTFDTAIEAAHRRWLYYKENKIPYGPMEIEIARLRAQGYKGTDAALEANVREYDASVGMHTPTLGEDDPAEIDYLDTELIDRFRAERGMITAEEVPLAGFEAGEPPEIAAALRKARP